LTILTLKVSSKSLVSEWHVKHMYVLHRLDGPSNTIVVDSLDPSLNFSASYYEYHVSGIWIYNYRELKKQLKRVQDGFPIERMTAGEGYRIWGR